MRIGILTYHKACNCGALIQAWALHRVLSRMGHDVSFPSCIRTGVPIFRWSFARRHRFILLDIISSCKAFARGVLYNGYLRWRVSPFKRQYIHEMPCRVSELASNYDLLVVGSDQVWNPKCAVAENYRLYIGDIPDLKQPMVGYAISGGDSALDEKTKTELRYAYDRWFFGVSFREKTLGEQLGIKNPIVALDPSLLLTRADYDEIECKADCQKGDYMFAYSATQNPKVLWKIEELGRALKMKVVFAQIYSHWFWNKGIPRSDCVALTPGEMIYHIRHAKFVVSSSFHGTAVSIANGARFVHITEQKPPYCGRAYQLVSRLGLDDRMVDVDTDIEKVAEVLDRGYSCNLDQMRNVSLTFLKDAIKSAKEVHNEH